MKVVSISKIKSSFSCIYKNYMLTFLRIRSPDDIYAEVDLQHADSQRNHLFGASNALGRESHGTRTSTTRSAISKHLDVEELEMLLEAYFVQIDGTLNKLSTVFVPTLCVLIPYYT